MTNVISVGGLLLMLVVAYGLSSNRKAIDFRIVAWGLALQFSFALFILKTTPGVIVFDYISRAITRMLGFADAGAAFVFGSLATDIDTFGFVFAFQVLPTIIFTSALFHRPLSPRDYAEGRSGLREDHVEDDAHQRRGVAGSRGKCVYGYDRGAPGRKTLRQQNDSI